MKIVELNNTIKNLSYRVYTTDGKDGLLYALFDRQLASPTGTFSITFTAKNLRTGAQFPGQYTLTSSPYLTWLEGCMTL